MMKSKVKTWITNMENGNIRTKTDRVIDALYRHKSGVTILDLREQLNMQHQTLTAIISQIEDEGLIEVIGEVQQGSSYYSIYRWVSDPHRQNVLKYHRQMDKVMQWVKKGHNDFAQFIPLGLYYELSQFLNQK